MPVSDFYTATFAPTVASASVTAVGSLIAATDQAGLVRGRAVPGRDHGRGGRVHGAGAAGQAGRTRRP